MNKNFVQILTEQRAEIPLILNSGRIRREQEAQVRIDSSLVQIITGVRRSGKSTLAHRVLKGTNYAYINFDDERLAGIDASDLDRLLETAYAVYGEFSHLLLDEIQNIDSWHLFVNRMLRNKIHVVLTGSNSKLLDRESATHLTGRYSLINLFPFSFTEFLTMKDISPVWKETSKNKGILQNSFREYLEAGGFPEIHAGEDQNAYLSDIFDAIVTRDIIYRYNIRNIRTLRDLATILKDRFAGEISYNRLKNILSLGSENTVKNYISYFEEAWLFLTLQKFSFKKQESLRNRKIYNIDTGFHGKGTGEIIQDYGRKLENIVFLHLLRHSGRLNFELYYYKKYYEVDFLIYSNRKVKELIQVAGSTEDEKTLDREIRALVSAGKELKAERLTLLTMDESRIINTAGKKIQVINLIKWLLELQ